jgi:LacI family gluconate utilization system Gnt-I transcriptional repressor
MVSLDLRERIDLAVKELGYIPNQLASALASARTNRVGVIVPSLTNGVFGGYLRAMHDVFLPAGFQVLVLNSGYIAGNEERAIATMLGQHPEAIILAGIDQTPAARHMLVEAAIPVIQTMEMTDDPIDIVIGLSQHDAGRAATQYMIDLGHKSIVQMSMPLDERARRRRAGYLEAMSAAGLEPLSVSRDAPSNFAQGSEMLGEMIERWPHATALFAGNDNLALGALFECQRRGIRVPDDISIVGFNDLEFAAASYPSLTTVATPRYDIGERAARIVLEIVRGSGKRPADPSIDLGFHLITRESSAPPTRRRP